jgi:peptide/nickel transport system permease protein
MALAGPARRSSLRAGLLHLGAVLILVTLLAFLLVELLPGDAAEALLGERATPEALAVMRADLGLDDPLPVRYVRWLGAAVSGDLGRSVRTDEPVLTLLAQRLPVSIELVILAQLAALALAVPAALLSAWRSGGWFDRATRLAGFALMSLPGYVGALLLILVFALYLRWLPAAGFEPWSAGIGAHLRSFALPALALACVEAPLYLRVLRNDLVEMLDSDFVRAARARGVPPARVLVVHALRPAAFTLLTLLGLSSGNLIGGAVIMENAFALPGLGRLLADAVYARDVAVIQSAVLVIALFYVLIHIAVEAGYRWLDPRLRRVHAG